ncbi:MAG TPA: DUF1850 domain-containing protein [Casimicrobiaceae bacterium]|nr:DUF1850 domain-containing protein [Casimicrobiaceae bacterium]
MNAVCLLVAGALRATIPADAFTLAWHHSIEKTRWEEDYRVVDDRLALVQSRIGGFGAGMEPPPGARLVDGMWRWRPTLPPLAQLRLSASTYTSDYTLCWQGDHCAALRDLVQARETEVVTLVACTR